MGQKHGMCGNGIRCVGKYVYDKGLTNKTNITVETLAGIKVLELNLKNGEVDTVKVDMGEPILTPQDIPVIAEENPVLNLRIFAQDTQYNFTCVSMGNPHAVTVVKDVDNFDVEKYGKVLEVDPHFPEKANIEFIEIVDDETVKMRVWERGTGETMACGTGACAVATACILNGYTKNDITVQLLGGELKISWNKENNHIYMTGPARISFEGELNK